MSDATKQTAGDADSLFREALAHFQARRLAEADAVLDRLAPRIGDNVAYLRLRGLVAMHRRDPGRKFMLEIVGFWTPEYLARKFAALRAAAIRDLVLCIDEDRNCAESDLPMVGAVVRYRRRIDPAEVLRAIEATEAARPVMSALPLFTRR